MSAELHCTRLPDLPIALIGGGAINLSHFCGQKLIIFFCPTGNSAAAAREIAAYEALASEFEHAGAWVVGILDTGAGTLVEPSESKIHLGSDADGSAFHVLAGFVPENMEIGAKHGTTFLIARDGGVRAAWPGCGHAAQALKIARERP